MPVRMRIGDLVKEQGLTIKALAERAGVAYNTAHALSTGRATRIDLDTLDRMCAALRVEPGELFVRHGLTGPARREHERERLQEVDSEIKPHSDRRAPEEQR